MGTAGTVKFHFECELCSFWRQNDKYAGVYALLRGHTDTVNAIKFFPIPKEESLLLVSGSSDGFLRLWQIESGSSKIFHGIAALEGHARSSINCLCVNERRNQIVSGSADSTLMVWQVDLKQASKAVVVQCIKPRGTIPLALASADLGPDGHVVLAVAGTKNTVQIWLTNSYDCKFEYKASLVGHESWVRSLAITREKDQADVSKPWSIFSLFRSDFRSDFHRWLTIIILITARFNGSTL